MVYQYNGPLSNLISELSRLPGIGYKTAQRLAFYILSMDKKNVQSIADALVDVKENVHFCQRCFNISSQMECDICSNVNRNKEKICVVSEPKDLIAMERTNLFDGYYHVLGGVISPINGIGPDQLRVKELMKRLLDDDVKEVILAFNPNVEGDATILYLSRLINPSGIKITRIAYGLPVGSDMDYADETTLSKAFEGRISL